MAPDTREMQPMNMSEDDGAPSVNPADMMESATQAANLL